MKQSNFITNSAVIVIFVMITALGIQEYRRHQGFRHCVDANTPHRADARQICFNAYYLGQ